MTKILRLLSLFCVLIFTSNAAYSAGYTCDSLKKYTACNDGYYPSQCDNSPAKRNGETVSAVTGGTCKACPSGHTCSGSNLNCPKLDIITITLQPNAGISNITAGESTTGNATIYLKRGTGYSRTNFGSTITYITPLQLKTPWTFRGYYLGTSKADVTGNDNTGTQVITKSGKLPSNTYFSANTTLTAGWARNCEPGTGCNCTLSVTDAGVVTYTTSAKSGYTLTSNASKYNPVCTANKYTVTLNANEGTAGSTTSVTPTYGSSMPTIATSGLPRRAGYTFAGYYDAASGGTQYYTATGASAQAWDKTSNTTLYAQWIACGTGYYCTGAAYNSKSACTSYRANTTTTGTTSSSSSQCLCKEGMYLSGSTCTDAGDGYFSGISNSRTSCSSQYTNNKTAVDLCTTTSFTGSFHSASPRSSSANCSYTTGAGEEVYPAKTITNCYASEICAGGISVAFSSAGGYSNIRATECKGYTADTRKCKSSCSQTAIAVAAGKQAATAKSSTLTTPAGTNWYTLAHTVPWGSTSSSSSNVKSCTYNSYGYQTPNTTTQTDHDAANDCKKTITLNKNGGSGTIKGVTSTSSASVTCSQGEACDFESASGLTQSGYTFKGGWGTSTSCTAATTSFTNPTTSTYYACKTPNTYKVTLDNQGATTAGTTEYYYQYNTKNKCYYYTTSELTTCIAGTDGITITPPTRSGYTFGGYYTGTGGSGTQYVNASGGTINNLYAASAQNITLYAKWTECTPCSTMTGANCSISVVNNACTYTTSCQDGYYDIVNDGKYNASCSVCGYGFYCKSGVRTACPPADTGWTVYTNTNASSSWASCYEWTSLGGTIDPNEPDNWCDGADLYRHASSASAYGNIDESMSYISTLEGGYIDKSNPKSWACRMCGDGTYNNDGTAESCKLCSALTPAVAVPGGTYSSVSPRNASTTCRYVGPDKATPANCATITKNTVSYNGSAWGTGLYSVINNPGYSPSGSPGANPSCPANTNIITLNKNGGTGTCGGQTSTTNGSFTCTTASSSTLPSWNSSSCNITKTNSVFIGWNTSNTATSAVSNSFTCPTGNATYYAVWKTPSCSKGTNVASASLSSVNSNNQAVCSCTCNAGYSQSGGLNTTTSFTTTGTAGTTSVTCSACSPKTLKVTLDNQGATTAGTTEYYYQYKTKNKCYYYTTSGLTTCIAGTDGITITRPERPGYTFGGYYTGTGGSGTQYVNADGGAINNLYTASAQNITLYAKWTASAYTITYKAGTGGSGADQTQSVTYKSSFTTKASDTFSKTNATFAGWSASSGSYPNANTAYTYTTVGNITLTATWNCNAGYTLNSSTGACDECGSGTYKSSVGNGSCTTCPTNYPNSDTGERTAITKCYSGSKSRAWTGSQVNGSVPTNCSAVTEWNACSIAACSYVAYSNSAGTGDGTVKSGCSTNSASCTKTVKAVKAKAGYYDAGTSCTACPTGYPNSDADNEGGITKCYSGSKSRAWTGSQTACDTPTNSYSHTCNSCSNSACSYVAYSNSAGTGDGTVKSGCSTNNAACKQSVKTFTCKASYYVNGSACSACSGLGGGMYKNSVDGNTGGSSACKTDSLAGKYLASSTATSATSCDAGTYKEAHTLSYPNTSSCSDCTEGNFCPEGASVQTSCATLGGGLYKNSAKKSGANTACYVTTTAGKYIAANTDTAQTTCPNGSFCTSKNIYWPNVGGTEACPTADSTTKRTAFPDEYYPYNSAGSAIKTTTPVVARIFNQSWWGDGWKSKSDCMAIYFIENAAATFIVEGVAFNTTSGKYDVGGVMYYNSVNGGFYLNTKVSETYCNTGTNSMLYKKAILCLPGHYCPGGTVPSCKDGIYNNDWGLYACQTGSYQDATGQTVCKPCAAGKTNTGTGNTAACTAACSNNAGVNAWATTTWNNGTVSNLCTVTNCSASYYKNSNACPTCASYNSKYTQSANANSTGVNACYLTTDAEKYVKTAAAGQETCPANSYCEGGTKVYVTTGVGATTGGSVGCPSGYASPESASAKNQCTINCAAGSRVTTADATCTAITSGNVYMLAHTVKAGSTSPAATSCPTNYTISGSTQADHNEKADCKISCSAGYAVQTVDAACAIVTSGYQTGTHTVSAGSKTPTAADSKTPSVGTWYSCLTNYSATGTAATDHDARSDCKINCPAGTRIAKENETSCTTPSGNWYVGAHTVSAGGTSSVNSCLTNYTISGTAATNHDAASDCKISCNGGAYIAKANETSCTNVGAGYWAGASTVSQGSAGSRTACASGLTTIGYGAGADEAADCGRILNVGNDKIYLRSVKKTTPSLNVKVGDTTYYGNMTSGALDGYLIIKDGNVTYRVHDDSK